MDGKWIASRHRSRIVAAVLVSTGLAAVAGVLPSLAATPAAPAAARNVLIVAPHPDDDVLIAAGIASRAKAAGATVKVAYMTNGDGSGFNAGLPNGQVYGTLREGEAVNAQSYVGLAESDLLFLGYPDSYLSNLYGNYTRSTDQLTTSWGQSTTYAFRGLGGTDYHDYKFGSHAAYNAPNVTQDLSTIMLTYRPDDIYTTAEFDQHSDHAASYWFAKKAIGQATASDATYSPVLHKGLVWSTDPASWPATANPQSPYTQPPGLAGTGVTWAGRESVAVPAAMQNTNLSVNPKALAIDAHGTQGGVAGSEPNGFLGRFIHSDEIFWTEQQVPPSTGTVPPPTAGGWQLNGSAALSGSSLRLTPASADQAGSAFWPTVMSSTTLTADFDLTISGGTGADGMTFVLANPSAPTALGGTGGALGFAGIAGLAVTFDTYLNSGSADPSANFVGIATGYSGSVDHLTYAATSTAVPNLRSGTHHAKVVASGGRLKVSVDGTQYLDAAVTLPSGVMVGFTGGTGGLTDQHAVTNVAITSGAVAPVPVLSVSPGSLAFGSVVVGSSKVLPVTVANTGNAPLTMGASTGPAAPFSATGLPANGTVIAAGASLQVNVTFAPTATTSSSGSVSFVSNGGSASVSSSGTGVPVGSGTTVPPPTAGGWQFNGAAALSGSSLRLTPATADQAGSAFWPTAVSSAAITAEFDFTISGGTGADGMTFVLANPSAGATALGDNGGALGFAGIAGVAVTFDTYLNSGSADPSANFVGIATGYSGATDHLTYAATSTAVPNLRSGTHHAKVVTNAGHLIVSVDGTQYLDAAVTLPSNVLVGFTGGTGGLTDQHAVTNAAITSGPVAPVPVLSVSPGSLAFGSVVVGSSKVLPVTVANTGNAPLTMGSSTGPSAPFSATGLPANGTVIAAGASLQVNVTFAPTATTSSSGSLSFVSNGGNASVSSSGTGVPVGSGTTVPPPTAGGWQFNGSAALSGSSLRLTPATADQAGSAFWPTAVSSAALTAEFDFTISGGTGADGMTFVLANPSAGATALGDNGGALGFAGIAGVAVTFDTYLNSGSADPSANFVGIATGYSGATDHLTYAATSSAVPNLRSGTHHAKVVTNAGHLIVSVDGTQYLDVAVTLPSNVVVGFTGGTGGLTDQHAITNAAITAS